MNNETKLRIALHELSIQITSQNTSILGLKRSIRELERQNEKLAEARFAILELLYQTDAGTAFRDAIENDGS